MSSEKINNEINGSDSVDKTSIQMGNFLSFGKPNEDINKNAAPVNAFDLKSLNPSAEKKENQKSLTTPSMQFSGSFGVKTEKKTQKPSLSSTDFLNKKRERKKILSSEELELERIKKEKEELKKQKKTFQKVYTKSKQYKPMHILPSPLTLIKPFHLSSSSSTQYLRRRLTSTNYEIEKINQKIKEKLEKKCEEYGEKMKENVFINEQIVNQNSNPNIDFTPINKNKFVDKIAEQNSESKLSLSSRINKYCEMTSSLLLKQSRLENQNGNN